MPHLVWCEVDAAYPQLGHVLRSEFLSFGQLHCTDDLDYKLQISPLAIKMDTLNIRKMVLRSQVGVRCDSVWMLKPPYLALNSFQHVVVLLVVVLSPERVGAVHVGHIDLQLRGGHQRLLDLCFGQFQWF